MTALSQEISGIRSEGGNDPQSLAGGDALVRGQTAMRMSAHSGQLNLRRFRGNGREGSNPAFCFVHLAQGARPNS